VLVGDLAHDAQAQAGARLATGPQPVIGTEHVFRFLVRHRVAIVGYAQQALALAAVDGHVDVPARQAMPGRVLDQVAQQLLQPVRVALHAAIVRGGQAE